MAFSFPRCAPRGLRGLSPCRCDRWGASLEAHRAGLKRVTQAGGKPQIQLGLAGVRASARLGTEETVAGVVEIVLTERLLKD